MDLQNEKCVMVLDENLPIGILTNTAAILGMTMGKEIPEVIGPDVVDGTGNNHLGVIAIPIPILKASPADIGELRRRLYEPEFRDLITVDFTNLAQSCKTDDEFIVKMTQTPERDLQYFGIAMCGTKKKVNRLTGNLPLLR